jgi:2,4-dichlorophenol 6-monooxygenase
MDIDVPVLIVGAGPVGLMAAVLLDRLGIDARIIERRATPQSAPAAHAVNARTLEICRAAGVDMNAIAAACTPPADAGWVRWMTTLAGEELGALPYEQQGDDMLAVTPTPLRNLSQHRFEPILVDTLRAAGHAVAWGHTWEAAVQNADGVTSTVRDGDRTYTIRSRWLVAADGAGSRVRKAVGIEPIGPSQMQGFLMLHFEANLRPLVGIRPAVLYWTLQPGAVGTFVAHDLDRTWVYMHPWDPDTESRDAYTPDACAAIIRRALGTDDYPFTIRAVSSWMMTAQVAERYRAERVFLVGDSAHRFPPSGGMGLNTGVQDAHNLAWKLAAVEHGWADEALLDSYECERRPIAQRNADVSVGNAMRMMEVFQAAGSFNEPTTAPATPIGETQRVEIAAAIANQAEHFDMLGLQLGFAYDNGALVPDPTPRRVPDDPVRQFLPTAQVGCRLPHAWVQRDGIRVSTLDCLPLDRFTLITHADRGAWLEVARDVTRVPITTLAIGRDLVDPDDHWTTLLDFTTADAILVRPDQHVAWRAPRNLAAPATALARALDTVVRGRTL